MKTPTAAAEFLIQHQSKELELLESIAASIFLSASNLLQAEKIRIQVLTAKIPTLFSAIQARETIKIDRLSAAMGYKALQHIEGEKSRISIIKKQLALYTDNLLNHQKKRIEQAENKLENASPERILKLGFSITRVNGQAIKSFDDVREGDNIETTLATGTINSTVTWKRN